MGKNKIRSKNRARKENTSISDNSGSNIPSTSTPAHENVITRSTSSTIDRQHLLAEPFRRKPSMPATTLLKDATTSNTSSGTSPAAPVSQKKGAQRKRDSVVSGTWEGRGRPSKSKMKSVKQPLWGFRPGGWWPCRALNWTYHFFLALIRIHWTDQQTFQDLVLTLALIGLVIVGFYVALDFLLRALPGVAAQALDGNCSIVYVTVPGPIITVSLIGASPTNPARGTYYFSIINGTTEWLNSIAPPSRFSTLITRTADITPIVSSLSITGTSSSGLATVSSTQTPTTSAPSIFSPASPGLGSTFTSSFAPGFTLGSSVDTSIFGSTPPPSSLALSSLTSADQSTTETISVVFRIDYRCHY
ncbi:hypothetical protein G6011_08472 [Alternaria panax]|uniref:Uncharacterized protein n=1 Tax=Alternaria panax TaxID=48097 RepID=A0AAD4FMK5_9PLEO|nr:hypothetical protein G6011_08472 [Alternaria panax]